MSERESMDVEKVVKKLEIAREHATIVDERLVHLKEYLWDTANEVYRVESKVQEIIDKLMKIYRGMREDEVYYPSNIDILNLLGDVIEVRVKLDSLHDMLFNARHMIGDVKSHMISVRNGVNNALKEVKKNDARDGEATEEDNKD